MEFINLDLGSSCNGEIQQILGNLTAVVNVHFATIWDNSSGWNGIAK